MGGIRVDARTGEVTPVELTEKDREDMLKVQEVIAERDSKRAAQAVETDNRIRDLFPSMNAEQRAFLASLARKP